MNKNFLLLLFFTSIPFLLQAQITGYAAAAYNEDAPAATDDRIHRHVDIVPLYEGCDQSQMFTLEKQFCSHEKIKSFLEENLQYPEAARSAGVTGKVKVWAVVELDGTVSEVRVIDTPSELLDAEAIRLVKAMPVWVPGKLKEKTVRSFREISINFTL